MTLNVFGLANSAIQAVNANISAVWRRSSGYTTGDDGIQIPSYVDTDVVIQAQPASGDTLAFTDGLNLQGVRRSVFMYGNVLGVSRSDERGGDLLLFADVPDGEIRTWKIVTVVETWPEWAQVVAVLQTDETAEEEA